MTEYRITDGRTIIIEIARTEDQARTAAAHRLACDEGDIQILETKRRPLTPREVREQSYWEKYADYLLRMERNPPHRLTAELPREAGEPIKKVP